MGASGEGSKGVVVSLAERRPNRNHDPSDAELVRRVLEGDGRAFDILYHRHAMQVLGLGHRLLAGAGDVDDLVQDTFLTAYDRLDRLEDGQAFAAWVRGIAVRLAQRRLRRLGLRRRLGLASREQVDADRFVSPDAPPDVGAELRALYALLGELRPAARIALVLRRVEGCTVDEVAEALGLSRSTAKRRIEEAEVLLASRLRTGGPR